MAGKAWWQTLEAAGHVASAVKRRERERNECWFSAHFLLSILFETPAQNSAAYIFRRVFRHRPNLHTSHAQRVVLDPVRLTINVNWHASLPWMLDLFPLHVGGSWQLFSMAPPFASYMVFIICRVTAPEVLFLVSLNVICPMACDP